MKMEKLPTTRILFLSLVLLQHFAVSTSLTCPYENINGFCLYLALEASERKLFCQAQEKCNSIGGRMITGFDKVMAMKQHLTAINMYSIVLLGATDLLHERSNAKTGWLFTDGGELPYVPGEWSNGYLGNGPTDDMLMLMRNSPSEPILIQDRQSDIPERFACEPWPENLTKTFISVPFPKHNTTGIYYCSEPEFQVAQIAKCALMCNRRPECAVFLYKEALKLCKLILHTDASVENVYEDDPDWKKYKRVW